MIKPYYEKDGITIYNCDCREVLPFIGEFDLCLTDPPYGIGEDGGKCRTRGKFVPNHVKRHWDTDTPSRDVFTRMFSQSANQMIFGANYFTDKGLPPSMGWIYWDKCMGGDFSDGELIFTSFQRALKSITIPQNSVDRQHPTQKPLKLLTACIAFADRWATNNSILDPFMGSGTTLVAAKQLGRRAVGIEIEEKYCEIAVQRLAQDILDFGGSE